MNGHSLPFVTVVIPTYERPAALARCLASLAGQNYPHHRFEVIVVNDGGPAPLTEVAQATASDLRVTLLPAPHGGPATARNRGAAEAQGEVLAFIDDDCTADRRWISQIVTALREHPDAALGGRVANGAPGNPYVRASHTLLTFLYRYYHEHQRGRLPFFTTNNLAVRAEVFARIGGFDASFTFASEDREFSDRCRRAGHPLVYEPDAVVLHTPDLSFTRFVKMHFRYGKGAWRFYRARARRDARAGEVEAIDFYVGMVRAPFASGDPQPVRQSLLLILSQVVAAFGFFHAALRATLETGASGRND